MKKRVFTGIVVSSLVGSLGVFLLPKPTLANPYNEGNINPLEDLQTVDNPDPFTNGGGLGAFDLLHRSRLGINRDLSQFTTEQRQSINNEAAQFRARQQQLILQQTNQGEMVEENHEVAP